MINSIKNKPYFNCAINISLLMVILLSGTVIKEHYSIPLMLMLDLAIGYMVCVFSFTTGHKYKNFILIIGIVLFLLLQLAILGYWGTFDDLVKLIHKIIIIFLLTEVIYITRFNFFRSMAKIIYGFMVVSFVIYVLMLMEINLPEICEHAKGKSILFLNVQNKAFGFETNLPRNYGIYWEPGMYQIYLNMILIYYLIIEGKIKKSVFIILNILTTFSITGYLVCGLIIFMFSILNKKGKVKKAIIFLVLLIMFGLVCPIMLEIWNEKMKTPSYEVRNNDFHYALKLAYNQCFIGIGLNYEKFRNFYYINEGVSRGNTNGLIAIVLHFGIIGIVFYFVGFCCFIKNLEKSFSINLKFMLLFIIVSLMNEPIQLHEFTIFILGMGYSYFLNRNIKQTEGKVING